MKSPKPIIFVGIIALGAVVTVIAYGQSLVAPQRVSSGIAQSEEAQNSTLPSTRDPYTTPAYEVYRPEVTGEDPIRGDKDAPVDIIEYGDFECPFCAQVQPVLEEVLEKYDGIVRVVWKDFPNPLHPQAHSAALAARCAQAQDSFWDYHDFLFVNQDLLSRSTYSQIAQKLDLNVRQFDACLDDALPQDLIGRTMDEAKRMRVGGTPYFLINGHRLDYAGEFDDFAQLIERAIVGLSNL